MTDFTDIGLDDNLNAITSLPNRGTQTIKEYVDQQINEITRPGGLNYSNISASGLDYKAVVSLDQTQGNFTDLQSAINYVSSVGGGKIFVRNGDYYPTEGIVFKSNVEIVGESLGATFYFGTNNYGFTGTNINGPTIERIRVIDSASTDAAIKLVSCKFVRIKDCVFRTNSSSGTEGVAGVGGDIYLISTDAEIVACESGGSDSFVKFDRAGYQTVVRDCSISSTLSHVFFAVDRSRGMLSNNYIFEPRKSTIRGDWEWAKFVGNIVRYSQPVNTDWQIFLSGTSGVKQNISIVGNHFSGQVGTLSNGGAYIDGYTFTEFVGNNIASSGTSGTDYALHLNDSGYCQISGNFFSSSGASTDSVFIGGNSDGNTFVGNYSSATGTSSPNALNIGSSTCDSNIIVGNRFSGGTTDNGSSTVWANNG